MIPNPFDSLRHHLARRRYLPRTRVARSGTIARVSVAALALIVAGIALLELRGPRTGSALAQYASAEGVAALDLVERAALRRRLVFIADIQGSAATKRFFADAVERVATGAGLDVVGLEVDASEQSYIDAYLSTPTEQLGILLSRPRVIREQEGVANAYLDIYRRVRRLNDSLGADRRIRILALDAEDWPPAEALPPSELARRFGERDVTMSRRLADLLGRQPRTRTLLFVDGLSALRGGGGLVQTGGTRTIRISWLARRLAERYPQDVYTILVDAPAPGASRPRVAAYRGTAAGPVLGEAMGGRPVAVPVRAPFAFTRQPIRTSGTPGINFEFEPRTFGFAEVADAYVYLGR